MATRRQFMQMLGFGAVAGGLTLAKPAPLFGAEGASQIWTPGQKKRIAGHHVVFTRPVIRPALRSGSVEKNWPQVTGSVFTHWNEEMVLTNGEHTLRMFDRDTLICRTGSPVVMFPIPKDEDPHLLFYQASMQIRDAFSKNAQQFVKQIPKHLRGEAQIVTLVDNPIFAGVSYSDQTLYSGAYWNEEPTHMRIETCYTQYAVLGEIQENGWEVYSDMGEYPIEIPSEIDMGFLLNLDRQFCDGKIPWTQTPIVGFKNLPKTWNGSL